MTTNALPENDPLSARAKPVVARLLRGLITGLIPQLPPAVVDAATAEITARLARIANDPEAASELLNADRGFDGLTDNERAAGFTAAGVLGDNDDTDLPELQGLFAVDRRVPGAWEPPDTARDTRNDAALSTEAQLASDRAREEINLGADGGRVIEQDPADGGRVIEQDPADGGMVAHEEGD